LQEDLRGEFASLIGAAPDEIAVTFSASNAIYAVASGLDYARRSKVLLGELEFPTQCHVWLAQQARGARIEWIPANEAGNSPGDYRDRLDGSVMIVPVTHVSYRNGFRNDVHELARAAQEAGAYFLLDDYQSCGTRPIDVRVIGADFYVTGALKYLLGCSGIAFLYVRREVIQCLHPTFTGWFAQRDPFAFDCRHHDPAGSANRFQSGSPPVPGIYAALAGIRLLKRIGLESVYARIREIARLFVSGAGARGWKLKTPSNAEGPLIVLEAGDEESARGIVNELGRRGIIVSSRGDGVRFSFHAYNTPGDVEAALSGLEDARRVLYHPGGR
jgi:selenocysteine lyase/cysteine desulfurase